MNYNRRPKKLSIILFGLLNIVVGKINDYLCPLLYDKTQSPDAAAKIFRHSEKKSYKCRNLLDNCFAIVSELGFTKGFGFRVFSAFNRIEEIIEKGLRLKKSGEQE